MAMARILCKTSWIIEIWDYYFDCPINFCQRFHHLANVFDERERMTLSVLTPILILTDDLELHTMWPVKCPWSRPDRPAALIRPGPGSDTQGCAAANCSQSGQCASAGLSNQRPVTSRGGDLPGSRDRGRCLEQELQFWVLQLQMTSLQLPVNGTGEWWVFFLVFQCFRICSRHVLLAGPPRKCIFLLHCVPFHSFVIEPWIHLRHLCLSFIQLYKKRRI